MRGRAPRGLPASPPVVGSGGLRFLGGTGARGRKAGCPCRAETERGRVVAELVSWVCLVVFLGGCIGVPVVGMARAVWSEPRDGAGVGAGGK